MRDLSLAHALLRIGLGVNFFMHGFARLPALGAFVHHTQETMAKTWLPLPLVTATGYAIPVIELVLGALLLLGFFLRGTLVAAMGFMFVLTFGICLAQNWPVASEQLIYLIALALLLAGARFHRFGITR